MLQASIVGLLICLCIYVHASVCVMTILTMLQYGHTVHEKVACELGPFHRTLSTPSRPSSAHLSAFSLRSSSLWAQILINSGYQV